MQLSASAAAASFLPIWQGGRMRPALNLRRSVRTFSGMAGGPIEISIKEKLTAGLQPVTLKLTNESHKHAGHTGNPTGAPDAETHFNVEIVSEAFQGKPLVARHRLVYTLLKEELDAGLHALALKTKTPSEVAR
ncbi:BOL1 [Auxenochlorella protothecoides x Auxenochlorella symbiontica]